MKLTEYLFTEMLTQAEFADKIECSRNYISMVCRGRSYPSRKLARKIYKITRGKVNFTDIEQLRKPVGRPKKLDIIAA